jgi:hypothetical protein
MKKPIDRFLEKVTVSKTCSYNGTPCYEWGAAKTRGGYGQFRLGGRLVYVHRFSYETFVGTIPEGMYIDHLCRNRCCVNPSHLEIVTNKENIRRGETGKNSKEKTHCPQGHPYKGDNLYIAPRGDRQCRECCRKAARKYSQKKRKGS